MLLTLELLISWDNRRQRGQGPMTRALGLASHPPTQFWKSTLKGSESRLLPLQSFWPDGEATLPGDHMHLCLPQHVVSSSGKLTSG